MQFGLTHDELELLVNQRMQELDAAQEDEEHLGAFGDLLRTAAIIAYHRAAELIEANNRRISLQLSDLGINVGAGEE